MREDEGAKEGRGQGSKEGRRWERKDGRRWGVKGRGFKEGKEKMIEGRETMYTFK